MHTFKIVDAECGWTIQLGGAVTTPCKSQATAIRQAEKLAAALRRHGEVVSVIVELSDGREPEDSIASPASKAAVQARTRASKGLLRTK